MDSSDDVRSVAASSLLPVVQQLVCLSADQVSYLLSFMPFVTFVVSCCCCHFFCVVFCYSVAKTRKLCICIISECRINCVCPISGLKLHFHFFSPPPPSPSRHNHNYYHHHPHTTTPSSPHLSHYHFLTTPPPPGQ